MKKSKIIIPALGVLVLSTAASITGTVAWFTANRTASITTGNFAVVKTDGDLDVECTSGVGTKITNDGSGNPTIVDPVSATAKLGDISFNPVTHQLWNDTGDGTKFRTIGATSGANSYEALPATGTGAHAWRINDSTYHAFTWKVTLGFTWGADETPLNVFFDYSESTMTAASQASGDYDSAKGFRIAMICGTKTIVWTNTTNVHRDARDLNSDSDMIDPGEPASDLGAVYDATHAYAYGNSDNSANTYSYFGLDKYAKGNIAIGSATAKASYAKAVDGEGTQSNREDYLGQITHTTTKDTIDIYCVAWYEGTDSSIYNDADLAKVSTSLKFYAALNA